MFVSVYTRDLEDMVPAEKRYNAGCGGCKMGMSMVGELLRSGTDFGVEPLKEHCDGVANPDAQSLCLSFATEYSHLFVEMVLFYLQPELFCSAVDACWTH